MLLWASIVIIVAGLRASASLVVPLLLALFLAILCGPPLEWLIRHGLRRGIQRAAGKRQGHGKVGPAGEAAGKVAGLRGAAQYEDAFLVHA